MLLPIAATFHVGISLSLIGYRPENSTCKKTPHPTLGRPHSPQLTCPLGQMPLIFLHTPLCRFWPWSSQAPSFIFCLFRKFCCMRSWSKFPVLNHCTCAESHENFWKMFWNFLDFRRMRSCSGPWNYFNCACADTPLRFRRRQKKRRLHPWTPGDIICMEG